MVNMLWTDIVYQIIIITVSYISIFHLILWFENRKNLYKNKERFSLSGVSIIIPAYNEELIIGKVLKNSLSLNYPKNKLETIVIDDGSTDNTYKESKKFAKFGIKAFRKKRGGKSSAINFGIDKCKNNFVAVMDADSFPEKNALRNCMKHFDNPKVAGVTSRILLKEKRTFFEKWQDLEFKIIALIRKVRESLNLVEVTPGPLSIYRKDILLKLGKFDEKNLVEDIEIAWRLLKNGFKVKMAYDALAYTHYPKNFISWWKQRTRWGIGGLQTVQKYLNCLFKYHPVGTFLLPLWFISYVVIIIGVIVTIYIVATLLVGVTDILIKSLAVGIFPFILDFRYDVSIMSFYGIFVFLLGMFLLKITLDHYPEKPKIFTIITFLTFYLFLFPIVTVYSFYKYMRREYSWLTK